jgi:HTH-type transcriptional regulator/antitoxin HigA
LGIVLEIERTAVNRLVTNKKSIDAEMAIRLESVFGLSAERFLEVQRRYDLALARIGQRPNPQQELRASLFSHLPITDMIKRGWIQADSVRDIARVEHGLRTFFGVRSLQDIGSIPHAAKKSAASVEPTLAQLAWLYRVRRIAGDSLVGHYSQGAVEEAIERLKPLRVSVDAVRKVPRILAESGIVFVMVESLPAAKIDGVCLWLDLNKPVIGMTFRYDRIDNFWFVLRHELEHVIRKHGQTAAMLDIDLGQPESSKHVPEEERMANDAASEFCAPKTYLDKFIQRKAPSFAERDLLGFSKTLNIHPGIVAGQLQHRTGRYDLFRNHLVKIRSAIAPNAVVDGWGDVAPIEI